MKENLIIPSEMLEEFIIVSAINNKAFFLKVCPYLRTSSKSKSYFNDTKNQLIFNMISGWYTKFNAFPTLKEIHYLIEKTKEDAEVKSLITAMTQKYYTEDSSQINQDMIAEETKKFIQEARVYEAMVLSQQDVSDENYTNIVERMRDAINVNFDKDLGLSIRDVEKVFEKINALNNDSNVISSGIPALDMYFDGGFHSKEAYIWAASPGVGKTLLLGCFAVSAFLQGKKVLVITLETGDARLAVRYYNNLCSKTKAEIFMNEEETKGIINEKTNETVGDIIIKEYGSNVASCNDFTALLTDLEMYKGWKPDLIVIDYILITSANDNRLDPSDSYRYYKRVTEDMRNMAKQYNVPILSACQINREGQGDGGGTKAIVTSKNISESRGVFDTADAFMTINQTAREREKNEIRIFLEKNRNDKSGVIIPCDVDYSLMRITEKRKA